MQNSKYLFSAAGPHLIGSFVKDTVPLILPVMVPLLIKAPATMVPPGIRMGPVAIVEVALNVATPVNTGVPGVVWR